MIYLRLYCEFFKVGLFAIGGGLTTIPFLNKLGASTGWFTTTDLTNMIAISESTPGPTGINMATYVGYITCGIPGSLIATLGIITPSIIIILLIAKVINKFKNNKYMINGTKGIRACAIGLISYAILTIINSSLLTIDSYRQTNNLLNIFDYKSLIIFVVVLILNKKIKAHPALFILISAILGIVIFNI